MPVRQVSPTSPYDCMRLFHLLALAVLALGSGTVVAETPYFLNTRLAAQALNSLDSGIRYKWGGTDPATGLDCSAFIGYLYRDVVGADAELPRTAVEIKAVAEKVSKEQMLPGDLVFFKNAGRSAAHVGIYIGNREFIHASRKYGTIRQARLDTPYWQKRFQGARRLAQSLPALLPTLMASQ